MLKKVFGFANFGGLGRLEPFAAGNLKQFASRGAKIAQGKWLSLAMLFAGFSIAAAAETVTPQISIPSPAIAMSIANLTAPNQHLTAIAQQELDPRLWPDISKQQIVREAAVSIRPTTTQFRTVENEVARTLTGPALAVLPRPDMSQRQIVSQGPPFVPPLKR
jgi:hypothetical protein